MAADLLAFQASPLRKPRPHFSTWTWSGPLSCALSSFSLKLQPKCRPQPGLLLVPTASLRQPGNAKKNFPKC